MFSGESESDQVQVFQECSTVFICAEFQRRLHLNPLKCSNGGRFFFVGQRNPLLSQVDRRPRDRPAGFGPGPARKSQPRRRRMGPGARRPNGAGRAGSESVQQAGCSQPPAGPGTASQAGPGPARSRCSVASEASSSSPATAAGQAAGGLQSEIRAAEPAALL